MNKTYTIFKKEIKSYFFSPLAYVITAIFSFSFGWLFFNILISAQNSSTTTITNQVLGPIFGNMNFILMMVCPLLTMRLFAEERKMNTLDLLLAAPIKKSEIIAGKLLASLGITLFIVSFTLIFPIILAWSGYSNWPVIITSYIGLTLNILCFLSIGLFSSSLTDNQLVAALIGFCILFALLLFILSANATDNALVAQMLQYITPAFHFEGYARGVIKSYNWAYYISFILFTNFLTLKSLEARSV